VDGRGTSKWREEGAGIVKMINGERSCMQGSKSKLALAACARVRGTIRSLEKQLFLENLRAVEGLTYFCAYRQLIFFVISCSVPQPNEQPMGLSPT
jgi:hypothetical protein